MTNSPALQFDHVRFAWPGQSTNVLDVTEFTLADGERLLLRGPSGCGKSTLLALAAGVLLAGSGEVRLMGQTWRGIAGRRHDQHRVDHVGTIFQQFNLLPYLSVLDNVLLPCRFSRLRAQRAGTQGSMTDGAKALLTHLGLAESLWRTPAAALSVGQQQRVAAARALIGQPELVIADEPTSALDDDRRDAFMHLLLEQCSAAGSALLFVSHDSRLAAHFERVVDLPMLNRATPSTTKAI